MKAFPSNYIWDKNNETYNGMDLRDWFAGQAMAHASLPTHIRQDSWKIDRMDEFPYDQFAKVIYKMADAMMKARNDRMEEKTSVPKD